MADYYCTKCRRVLSDANFYTYREGNKCEICKNCLTMHVDNDKPETFTWILEKFDVPYIPQEWNSLRDRAYKKDPYHMTGLTVLGKYLSKMRLQTWQDYRWADTERLKQEQEERDRQFGTALEQQAEKLEEMRAAYERGEISEAQYMTYQSSIPARRPEFRVEDGVITTYYPSQQLTVNANPYEQIDLPDVAADLTDEDKIYLALKWGQLYTAADWVTLENLYADYEKSFDIHSADMIAGIKQICKLDFKMNQALDTGDIENYSKLAKSSDSLRKSLKLTEAQRKEKKAVEFSCFGEIVNFCEKEGGYIPPLNLDVDRDMVDKDISDIKSYTRSLVEDDPAVFKLIEEFIKKRQMLEELKEQEGEMLTDEDLTEYNNFLDGEEEDADDEFTEST